MLNYTSQLVDLNFQGKFTEKDCVSIATKCFLKMHISHKTGVPCTVEWWNTHKRKIKDMVKTYVKERVAGTSGAQ